MRYITLHNNTFTELKNKCELNTLHQRQQKKQKSGEQRMNTTTKKNSQQAIKKIKNGGL